MLYYTASGYDGRVCLSAVEPKIFSRIFFSYACIAGSLFATYISFGSSFVFLQHKHKPQHILLCASKKRLDLVAAAFLFVAQNSIAIYSANSNILKQKKMCCTRNLSVTAILRT